MLVSREKRETRKKKIDDQSTTAWTNWKTGCVLLSDIAKILQCADISQRFSHSLLYYMRGDEARENQIVRTTNEQQISPILDMGLLKLIRELLYSFEIPIKYSLRKLSKIEKRWEKKLLQIIPRKIHKRLKVWVCSLMLCTAEERMKKMLQIFTFIATSSSAISLQILSFQLFLPSSIACQG